MQGTEKEVRKPYIPTHWQEDQEHEKSYLLQIRHVGSLVSRSLINSIDRCRCRSVACLLFEALTKWQTLNTEHTLNADN